MERLNYGRVHHDDYQEGHQEQWASRYDKNPDDDHDGEDYAETLQEQRERVEHQADHAADDSLEPEPISMPSSDGRSTSRRRQRGRFVPPDIRAYAAPVFVRVAGLQAGATSGSGETPEDSPATPPVTGVYATRKRHEIR